VDKVTLHGDWEDDTTYGNAPSKGEAAMTTGKEFDLMMLEIGYHKFMVPKKFALQLFQAASEGGFYRHDASWEGGKTTEYAKPMTQDEMPVIRMINPVIFHIWLENQRMKEEKEMKAERKKAAP
jgi:hypothetical protein